VGGVKQIAEETGCKVYLHEDDLTLPSQLTLGTIPYTNTYKEADKVSLAGVEFTVLHTPGHTPGSVCLLCEDALFAGDTLFQCSIGRTDFSDGNYGQLIHSIQTQLLSLPSHTIVYPGHGDTTTIENEMKYNPYL
jgi:glyoxylase-like metal-dependent hydrolase (beta-lactamase superfamily II)